MATQKRRVIHMADEDWSMVAARAAERGLSLSALLRSLVASGPEAPRASSAPRTARIVELEAEVARLKRELASRPAEAVARQPGTYQEFRPVPKPR